MKKIMLTLLILVAAFAVRAQEVKPAEIKGFWVVEGNINNKRTQTVKFYDMENRLIYEERITGKKIRYEKPKNQKKLNEVLATVLANTQKTQEKNLLAVSFQK